MTIDEAKRQTLRRFAAVGAGSPLVGLAAGEDGNSDAREAIVGYVETNPGTHFSKIRDELTLATGETQYHLRQLTEAGSLTCRRDGDYKRYVPAGRFDQFEQMALGYLRRDTTRAMVLQSLERPGQSGQELARALEVSAATISKFGSTMEETGLLDRTDGYRVERPETVLSLLLRYGSSFDENTRSFAENAAALFRYDP